MRIVAVANQKGGCGKTTTAINLAHSLSLRGYKVLLVDCDPQSHATLGLKVDADFEKSMFNVMTTRQDEQLGMEDIVIPVKDNFYLAPSSIILGGVEQELAGIQGRENILLKALGSLKQAYDFIIIDCPPSIGHLCFNALRACSEVIVPIDMSLFSLRGVAKLLEIIILFQTELGHNINTRALITMYDIRTRYSRRVLEKVKEVFGNNVFEAVIRYNIRLRETVDYGLPVGDYDKHSIGHQDYEKLAEETVLVAGMQAVGNVRDFLHETKNYIDTAGTGIPEMPDPDSEGFLPLQVESSYSEMVETILTETGDAIPEKDDASEEYISSANER